MLTHATFFMFISLDREITWGYANPIELPFRVQLQRGMSVGKEDAKKSRNMVIGF